MSKNPNILTDNHELPQRIPKKVVLSSGPGSFFIQKPLFWHPFKNKKEVDPDKVWIPPGQSVKVADKTIPGGMVYVGKYLQMVDDYSNVEPSLIIPTLPVNWSSPDDMASRIHYLPSYTTIHSKCRAAYLNWLISGRKDPNYHIRYVFLFLYGLERRYYVDSKTSRKAQNERPLIIQEVKRLLSIYGSNRAFNFYANELIETDSFIHDPTSFYYCKPPDNPILLNFPLLMGLGKFVYDGKPIPSDWAYTWIMRHPETRVKMPAKRCHKEFKALFHIHYTKQYKEGMIVQPIKKQLEYTCRPANYCIQKITFPCDNIPDVSKIKAPISQLNQIVDKCTDALEPLSLFLARNPDQANSIQALSLLPEELISLIDHPKANDMKKMIYSLLGDHQKELIHADKLIQFWPSTKKDRLTKKETTQLVQLFERLEVGLEPDPRFGGNNLNAKGKVVLFKLPKNAPKTTSTEYKAATICLHLAAIVSCANGPVEDSNRLFIEKHIEQSMDISLGEKIRLQAHLTWLLNEQPGMAGMKKRIELLKDNEKKAITAFCVGVASANGHIEPSEIQALTKIYSMLGLQADDVYTDIHSMMSALPVYSHDWPVSVQKGEQSSRGYRIPSKPGMSEMQKKGVDLDMKVVLTKLKETAEVSQILGDIFQEDTEEAGEQIVPSTDKQKSIPKTIGSLDSEHSELLMQLIKQPEWSREAFEALAEKHDLLPDGALDMINDAAYEICDEPLIDGDDPILVDMDVAKEMIT